MAEENPSSASITYLVTGLPKFKSVSQFEKYFGLKRNCGGAGEIADCEAISDSSILLTYEKIADAPKVMEYTHKFDGNEAKLHPLLKEKVTVTYQGAIADLIDVEKEKMDAERDELLLCYHGDELQVEGNWYNIERFRSRIKSRMLESLKRDGSRILHHIENSMSESNDAPMKLPAGSVHLTSLSNDALSLMLKCGVYQNDHLTYDTERGRVIIECSGDEKAASTIAEEFQTEYSQLMMGGKLKEHSFPIPDTHNKQQIEELISQLNTDYSQSVFKCDEKNKVLKCLSMSARQLSHIKTKMKELLAAQSAVKSAITSQSTASSDTATNLSLSLPGGRVVTLKQANIVEEDVDVIVNAANDRLVHGAGVAAAINRASQGKVQQLSTVLFQANGPIPTGQVTYTEAGGTLKCKYVIHAVGPEQYKHKSQCKQLLQNACSNALQQAEKLRAESIAFPPISSGLFGLPKETVAEVLINTACDYHCQNTAFLKDIRIVILDKDTFDNFLPFFDSKRRQKDFKQTAATGQSLDATVSAPHHTRPFIPQRANSWSSESVDNCPICLNPIVDKETTSCHHSYCRACLQKALHKKPLCPICNQALQLVTGNQPDGQMRHRTIGDRLPGYLQYGTIKITYDIPSGIQGTNHPKPGECYTGCTRVAYLPDSPEGREVLNLLKKAFDAKLIFTIGTSRSSGRTNTVIWNSHISHKTSMDGGPNMFGYPDNGYLQRVKDQLQLKGIM